jgi:sigma-B regulation protein RsbQ
MPAKSTMLVFVHGWACDKTVWDQVRSLLEPDFETFASDIYGFGERENELRQPEDWTLSIAVQDLAARVRDAGPGRVVVVGSSMGAGISVLAAARGLVSVDGLVAIGATPKYLKGDGYDFGIAAAEAEVLIAQLRKDYRGSIRSLSPVAYFTEEDQDVVARSLKVLSAIANRVRSPEKPIRILEKIYAGLDLRESLGKISVPVLLLHGDRDAIAPPAVGRFLEERIPHAKLEVIPGAGHLAHLTAPEKVAEAIARFASSISL